MTASKSNEGYEEALIEKARLIEIIENAKKKRIPYDLLGYLWELWDSEPDEWAEPPTVRSQDALTEVLSSFWEQDLQYELLSYLLWLEEAEDSDHKIQEPQPKIELESPANLYQLVRKAWDHNRMDELIAMIAEYEDLMDGRSIEEAILESLAIHEDRQEKESQLQSVKTTEI